MRKKLLITIIAAVASVACNDSTGTTEELRSNVSVSFSTQSAAAPTPTAPFTAAAAILLDDTLTSGSDTLIITRAQIVLREIELKQVSSVDCDVEPEPVECESVEVGPVLVDLPLTPGAQRKFTVNLPMGTFTQIDFEIHKVGDDPEDQAFVQANPDFLDKSIRVSGTFNGQQFTFESDLNVDQELALVPALIVTEGVSTNVTVRVDLATWFRSLAGGLVDPATGNKGELNENLIKDNIKQSLKAFEDEDEDGDESDET